MDAEMLARRMAGDAISNISKWDIKEELQWEGVDRDDRDDMADEVMGYLDNAQIWMGN